MDSKVSNIKRHHLKDLKALMLYENTLRKYGSFLRRLRDGLSLKIYPMRLCRIYWNEELTVRLLLFTYEEIWFTPSNGVDGSCVAWIAVAVPPNCWLHLMVLAPFSTFNLFLLSCPIRIMSPCSCNHDRF